ncbi:hypothetical protein C0992_011829 [Termitomyces sp. T32_za158]|nr:hypothetical protein C0992_011829 [Termitomyces sp. T32_za158]
MILTGLGILQATLAVSAVTVYPTVTTTFAAAAANYTGAAAYDPTVLTPPPVPSGLNTQFVVQLQSSGTGNLSQPQNGSFIGFSIEMTLLQVPFLNLMANLQERSGRVNVRVGGNTQETARMVDSTPDGKILEKNITGASNPYGPQNYFQDFGTYIQDMVNANLPGQNLLVGPNLAYADWTTEQVWDTGFVSTYSQNLALLSVENYPTDNCAAQFNTGGTIQDPQAIFPGFLSHTAQYSGHSILQKFLNSTNFALQNGKRLYMMETNTGSCGGFAGISDAFGSALWGIDYAFQMAFNNFAGGMIHVGGQNVFYNPFTPPPTNQSTFHQWTVGPTYYTALVAAESIGPSNGTQVLDLGANGGNDFTPCYGFYENGAPVRVGCINYVTDPTGASDLKVQIAIGGSGIGQPNQSPATVKVKYLLASSVSQKGNFTWAGQTFGDNFASDGRPVGDINITTITCDGTTNLCTVPVPAPSYALIYLTDTSLNEPGGAATQTFATTVQTRFRNTATVDQAVLATSNGGYGKKLGSTSSGSSNAAVSGRLMMAPGLVSVLALVVGLGVLQRVVRRG